MCEDLTPQKQMEREACESSSFRALFHTEDARTHIPMGILFFYTPSDRIPRKWKLRPLFCVDEPNFSSFCCLVFQ